MHKLLIPIFLFLFISVFGQEVGPIVRSTHQLGIASSVDYTAIRNRTGSAGFSAGIHYTLRPKQGIIRIDIGFQFSRFSFHGDTFYHAPGEESDTLEMSYITDEFFDIPVNMNINFYERERFALYFLVGMSYSHLIRSSFERRFYDQQSKKELYKYGKEWYKSNHRNLFGIAIGIGAEFQLGRSLSLSIEPQFRAKSSLDFIISPVRFNPGVNFSIRKNF